MGRNLTIYHMLFGEQKKAAKETLRFTKEMNISRLK